MLKPQPAKETIILSTSRIETLNANNSRSTLLKIAHLNDMCMVTRVIVFVKPLLVFKDQVARFTDRSDIAACLG